MRLIPAVGLALLPLLAGCGGAAGPASTAAGGPGPQGRVVVLAAASLTEVLEPVAAAFEDAHPGVDVVLSFGGSSSLAQQVVNGAPADVLAAASPAAVAAVVDAGDAAGTPRLFARNALEIAVPRGNPGDVDGLADLADASRRIALCAEQVPCGAAAQRAFAAAGLTAAPDTLEQDVKAVLSKVVLGEVDAGLVYATDVRAAGDDVVGLPFPEAEQAVNDYAVVALREAPDPAAAAAFVDHLLADEAQQALAAAGFLAP